MRHLALYPYKISDIGAVEVRTGATKPLGSQFGSKRYQWQLFFLNYYYISVELMMDLLFSADVGHAQPHTSNVTLPLPGFCSFRYKLYKVPPASTDSIRPEDRIWEFIRATSPNCSKDVLIRETEILKLVRQSGRGAASPFTRLVEEILDIKDRGLQLSFLRVVWLEKLLAWKMKTFGLYVYLTRTALPMLLLFSTHLAAGVLLTEEFEKESVQVATTLIRVLACIEAIASCFILSVKVRQLLRIPRLFFRSLFNYIDGTALCLGLTMFFLVMSKNTPSRPFLGFSTLLIWIATILMLRIYRPVGMLLLLLTETIQEIFSFLALLIFIVIGV